MTNVRVVLDTGALVAYARLRGMAVGELVMTVAEDGGGSLVAIPAACFLTAYDQLDPDEQERLVHLATASDAATVILPLPGTDTIEVARLGATMGHAIVETRRWEAIIATYDPAAALKHLPPFSVLELGED